MSGNGDGGYDSYMGVYHDYDHPYDCPCPPLSPAPPLGDIEIARSDEGCNGIADEGSGIVEGLIVFPGECWTVRLGGWGEGEDSVGRGRGAVDISTLASACFPSNPPEPERLDLPFNPASHKLRYLSFEAQDVGHSGNVRITFFDLPAPYDTWNGCKIFVQVPEEYCENAGAVQAGEDPCPAAVGGLPSKTFLASSLSCSPLEMGSEIDWNALGTVHVFHEGIVPGGVYHVQVVDDSCSTALEASYSDPLVVEMSAWADLVWDCSTTPCSPPRLDTPDTGIVDVTAVLDKYKNLPGNVIKARADLEGCAVAPCAVVDQLINITDVTFCLGAFLGDQYPPPGFQAPSPKPPCCP
jgi:hypothetical protein